jgi:hypothetical protein
VLQIKNAYAKTEETAVGTIYTVPWDKGAITIVTHMGKEYFIVNQPFATQFFELENKVVRVWGFRGKNGDGFETFEVTRFEVMKTKQ